MGLTRWVAEGRPAFVEYLGQVYDVEYPYDLLGLLAWAIFCGLIWFVYSAFKRDREQRRAVEAEEERKKVTQQRIERLEDIEDTLCILDNHISEIRIHIRHLRLKDVNPEYGNIKANLQVHYDRVHRILGDHKTFRGLFPTITAGWLMIPDDRLRDSLEAYAERLDIARDRFVRICSISQAGTPAHQTQLSNNPQL